MIMHLTIDPARVTAIQIDGTWTNITGLTIAELNYQGPGFTNHRIGPGYQATDPDGHIIAGPLSAITAVELATEDNES